MNMPLLVLQGCYQLVVRGRDGEELKENFRHLGLEALQYFLM